MTKYVVVKVERLAEDVMLIFPEVILHSDFVNNLGPKSTVLSAGFILLRDGELVCHGESISLDKKSRPEDSELANKMLRRP